MLHNPGLASTLLHFEVGFLDIFLLSIKTHVCVKIHDVEFFFRIPKLENLERIALTAASRLLRKILLYFSWRQKYIHVKWYLFVKN